MLRLWQLLTTGCWHHWEIQHAFRGNDGVILTRYDTVCFCSRCGSLKASNWKARKR